MSSRSDLKQEEEIQVEPQELNQKDTYESLNMDEEAIDRKNTPELVDWRAGPTEEYYTCENDCIRAKYSKICGMKKHDIEIFQIEKFHYKQRMPDIVHHLNYFLTFFDTTKESYLSILSVKYLVDTHREISENAFIDAVMKRIITPSFVHNCKRMANRLYNVNVNTDPDGKYRNSPKITNVQAKQIVALSFCFRFILPLCIHFSNVGDCFITKDPRTHKNKRETYLECFNRLFNRILARFEQNDVHVFTTLCKFIVHRAEKQVQNNKIIFAQKEMLRGDTPELYIENIIHDVIIVKSLYKLDYTKSCVSFFDGIVGSYGINYNKENYHSKPTEIDPPDTMKDSDDRLSHAESIEMSVYKCDESVPIISDVNRQHVIDGLEPQFRRFHLDDNSEELNFYYDNLRFNEISDYMLHIFYTPMFNDPYATHQLNRKERVKLQIYMKKYLERQNMPLLAQLSTATIHGKYRELPVRNSKIIESVLTDPIYEQILKPKYRYVDALDPKSNQLIKKLVAIDNASYKFVDFDPEINGYELSEIDQDMIKREYLQFLSIV